MAAGGGAADGMEAAFAALADTSGAFGGAEVAGLNSRGYPLNPGAQECAFYMKTGSCKFGATCRFDHPEGAGVGGELNTAGYPLNAGSPDCTFFMKTGQC